MGSSFLDDFSGDLFKNTIVKELQTSLQKAVQSSPKSVVTAHYPKNDYETAQSRMHIQANLDVIRKNPNNTKGIKIYIDAKLDDGTYSFETEPDFAKIEMSYSQFCRLTIINFAQDIIKPLFEKLKTWDEAHDLIDEPDPFNAFDGVEEDIVVNSEPEFDEIKGLLEDGQMIEAIKVYREITGLGLAEAKDAIDKYIIDKNIKVPTNNQNNKHVTNKNTIPSNETNSQQNTQDTSNSGCLTAAIMIGIFVIFVIVKISSLF